jgi:hypothetical protein
MLIFLLQKLKLTMHLTCFERIFILYNTVFFAVFPRQRQVDKVPVPAKS